MHVNCNAVLQSKDLLFKLKYVISEIKFVNPKERTSEKLERTCTRRGAWGLPRWRERARKVHLLLQQTRMSDQIRRRIALRTIPSRKPRQKETGGEERERSKKKKKGRKKGATLAGTSSNSTL